MTREFNVNLDKALRASSPSFGGRVSPLPRIPTPSSRPSTPPGPWPSGQQTSS